MLDATELLRQMATAERTAAQIVAEHLGRLHESQPTLNAATQIFADQATAEAAAPRPGPLSGLPISVKETFGLAGYSVTAGSVRKAAEAHHQDAEIVRRLRAAGAIVLARSNVPELAMAGETDNLRYGRTNNPYNPALVAGGSSGGEGALVASGSTVFGVGSDILGSIRIPAAFCGIVGFKPSAEAVDKTGTWPKLNGFMDSWLALGTLTRTVRDARLVYNVIAKEAIRPFRTPTGLRIIIPEMALDVRHPSITTALTVAETALKNAGLQIERHPFPDIPQLYNNIAPLLAAELEPLLRAELTTAKGEPFSLLSEMFRQWRGQPTIYKGLYQLLAVAPLVRPRRAGKTERIIAQYKAARAHYHALLGADGVLLLPTLGFLAPPHGQMNKQSLRPGVNKALTPITLPNYLNLPAIALPAWDYADPETGLPPSLMLACAPGAEANLFDVAQELERLVGSG